MRAVRGIVAATVCLGLTAGLVACGDSDSVKLTKQVIRATEKDTGEFAFTDNPPKSKSDPETSSGPDLSAGDQIGFRSDLLQGGNDAGDLLGHCFVISAPGKSFEKANVDCEATMTFPKGDLFLSVGGTPFATGDTKGAVTGGTGDYAGATGSFVSRGENNSKDTITIWVPSDD